MAAILWTRVDQSITVDDETMKYIDDFLKENKSHLVFERNHVDQSCTIRLRKESECLERAKEMYKYLNEDEEKIAP